MAVSAITKAPATATIPAHILTTWKDTSIVSLAVRFQAAGLYQVLSVLGVKMTFEGKGDDVEVIFLGPTDALEMVAETLRAQGVRVMVSPGGPPVGRGVPDVC